VTAPAFETLLDRHQREIMGYIVRSLGDHDLAQDVFQETFLRAFRAYRRLPAEANHRAWLYKIASNACHDAHRQRVRSPLPLNDSLPGADPPGSDAQAGPRVVGSYTRCLRDSGSP
jgi:RNA polymerase sigma-70 factor (ECF subfamily)